MKHLPLKLGIAVVLLFSAVIATCLLWTPVKIRLNVSRLNSNDSTKRYKAWETFLSMGKKGRRILKQELNCDDETIQFIADYWKSILKPDKDDFACRSALHFAVLYNDAQAARLLIKLGADVNAVCKGEKTPLHMAVDANSIATAKVLIKGDANVNCMDERGLAPLHIAASRMRVHFIDLLISNGAKVNITCPHGDTPLDMAYEKEIINFLRAHGAKTGEELKASGVEGQGSSVDKE